MKKIVLFTAALVFLPLLSSPSQAAQFDRSFGFSGTAAVAGDLLEARSVTETPDGKLTVFDNPSEMALGRLLPDGSPDLEFGTDGVVHTSDFPKWHEKHSSTGYGTALAINGKGRILATGNDSRVNSGCAFLSRLFPNGSLDQSFADKGKRSQCLHKPAKPAKPGKTIHQDHLPGRRDTVGLGPRSIDLAGGRILVAGEVFRNWSDSGAFVARFNPNGSLDRSFKGGPGSRSGERGIVELERSEDTTGEFTEVKALRHRKVMAAGQLDQRLVVARFRKNGALDPSFGKDGYVHFETEKLMRSGEEPGEAPTATGIAFDSKGRILVSGRATSESEAQYNLVVIRLTRSGKLDRTFGHGGIVRPRFDNFFKSTAVVVQRDGRIVISGSHGDERWSGILEDGPRFALVRLRNNGKLDRSFFDQGVFLPFRPDLGDTANDLLIDRRGRIVAAGGGSDARLIRILPGD